MGRIKEKFIPVQINQELCVRCERCLHACNSKAIYFENSIRLIDYSKCKACLNLFYKDIVKDKENNEIQGIRFKFKDIAKCQGCLKCVLLCPEKAIKTVTFKV